jgi:hypothetical protein
MAALGAGGLKIDTRNRILSEDVYADYGHKKLSAGDS